MFVGGYITIVFWSRREGLSQSDPPSAKKNLGLLSASAAPSALPRHVHVVLDDLRAAAARRGVVRGLLAHFSALEADLSTLLWLQLRLILMTIPFPGVLLNQGIVRFGDVVFNIRIGTLRVFSIITVIAFVVLVGRFCLDAKSGHEKSFWRRLTVECSANVGPPEALRRAGAAAHGGALPGRPAGLWQWRLPVKQ